VKIILALVFSFLDPEMKQMRITGDCGCVTLMWLPLLANIGTAMDAARRPSAPLASNAPGCLAWLLLVCVPCAFCLALPHGNS
jgi:hypothetical protein